ncbi:MFS transporter [Enterobacteriaceae bacterium C34A]
MTSDSLSPSRPIVISAGVSQLINWGITFYLPGTFVNAIMRQTGWPSTLIYGGLTLAMLVMAAVSPFTARMFARFGGQRCVIIGTLIVAFGCFLLASACSRTAWLCVWGFIGIGMRLALYDALFAALVGLYGADSRPIISKVALFGGLASVVFWPLGAFLLTYMSWRDVMVVYGLLGMANAGLLLALPNQKISRREKAHAKTEKQKNRLPALLYALFIALMTFVSNGTSTHLPELIAGAGLPVAAGMLWGLGQTGARFLDVLSGSRLMPSSLAVVTALLIPLCFLLALAGPFYPAAIALFALGYGAVNGLMTVVKATLPLQLFSPQLYAGLTGTLFVPAQLLAAASPFVWAWLNTHIGMQGTMWFSLSLGVILAFLALALAKQVRVTQQFSARPSRSV